MEFAKQLLMSMKENNLHNGYGLQKECESLVSHVFSNMIKSKIPSLNADVKNEQDSAKFREDGNQSFVMGEDDEAIEKYTMSLAFATTFESMAHAFANRSAALYRKQLYRECLIDIDAALSHGYPEEKKKKLKERAQKAVESLRLYYQPKDQNMNVLPSHKDSFEQNNNCEILENGINLCCVKEIINNDVSSEEKIKNAIKEKSVDELMSKETKAVPRYIIDEQELRHAHGQNKEVPALSSGVDIAYSKKYGRHLIATKSFKPGSIIGIEKPFACVLYREKFYTHCHHCLASSYNLIPCSKCPITLYCSEKCKTSAWEEFHRIECPVYAVLSKLLNLDKDKIRILTKIIRLLLVVTKNGTVIDDLRKDIEKAEKNADKRTAGFTDEGTFDSFSSRSALSLATNLAERPLIEVSAFACVSALSIILLATETSFFGKKFHPDQLKTIVNQEDVKFCGALVFRNCVIISSNSFSLQQDPGVKAGSGLYVAASLMNHSCAPNTFRHFDGLTMITRSLEPINEGDQIFTCYGGGYQYMIREERRNKMFRDYMFLCDCQACIENWPTYIDILRNHIGSIAKTKPELVKKLKPYRQRLMANKYDIDAVKGVLDILYAEVKMPCEEIVHASQYLKSYYLDP